ncbi:MAG: hypothetical protein CMJ85_08715 [Planctomycetes bacterium]|nr:hypothetical protein [Planctomycetota bacterium]MDP6425107.1 hypothetical protein [Planctomycetota bacterium]
MITTILLLLLVQVAPKPATQDTVKQQPATNGGATNGAAKPSTKNPERWARFRKLIKDRSAADHQRLQDFLTRGSPLLSDLSLDYRDSQNRAYLERQFDKLAKLDPNIGGVLIDYLDTSRTGALKMRAENVRRVLAKLDLTAYLPRLLEMLKDGTTSGQLRALQLLVGMRAPNLAADLKRRLSETPETHLPRLLACVGRYGDATLSAELLPFLARPSKQQVLAALRALAALGSPAAIEPAAKAALAFEEAGTLEVASSALLRHLEKAIPKLTDADLPLLVSTLIGMFGKADQLRQQQVLHALHLMAGIDSTRRQRFWEDLRPALEGLLVHRYPDVKFEAARLMDQHGDRSGIKRVLDQLNQFVKTQRRTPFAYAQRAKAYVAFGRLSDAIRDIKDAIRYSAVATPALHLKAARIEVMRGNASSVAKHLKEARPTKEELNRFRAANPRVMNLAKKSRALRKLMQQ